METQRPPYRPCSGMVRRTTAVIYSFERGELLIATSKNIYKCVCSINLGFSGGSANRYCYAPAGVEVPHGFLDGALPRRAVDVNLACAGGRVDDAAHEAERRRAQLVAEDRHLWSP